MPQLTFCLSYYPKFPLWHIIKAQLKVEKMPMLWKPSKQLSVILVGTLLATLLVSWQAGAQSEPTSLTIGFYGDPTSFAAQGMQLAIEQINQGVVSGQDSFPYTFEAVVSQNPNELSQAIAVLAMPGQTNNEPLTWTMPVFVLGSRASLRLVNIDAPIWRGMTSQAILDEMAFNFYFSQLGAQRVAVMGDSIEMVNLGARLQAQGLTLQYLPSSLLTAEEFQNLMTFNPQVFFYNGDAASATELISALGAGGWQGYFVYNNPQALFTNAGFVLPTGIRLPQLMGWHPSLTDSVSQAFTEAYQSRYSALPNAEAAAAYDLAWVLRVLVDRHGATGPALAAAIPTTNVIRTTNGQFNPSLYGRTDVYRSGAIVEWLGLDQVSVISRFDADQWQAEGTSLALPTPTPFPSSTPAYYTYTVTSDFANVRQGPSESYQIMGQLPQGQVVQILGERAEGGWYMVQSPFGPGWVIERNGTVFAPSEVALLPLNDPPPVTPTPTATQFLVTLMPTTPNGPLPSTVGNSSFELGGQVISQDIAPSMRGLGMTWLKEQVRWEPGETADKATRGAVTTAHSQNLKILVGSMGWPNQMGDFDTYLEGYTAYLRQVAALNPDAIEIWNEPNVALEWPRGQINGANYTRMLQAGYNAIKSVNPNIMVISAAPAPTGFFKGCTTEGCDDDVFIRQMAQAGAAAYLDCVGVHFNESIVSPRARTGDPRGSHHSYYLPAMLDLYTSVFPGKPLCFTELGYLTGEDVGLPSGFEWAAGNTLSEHAQWSGEAIQVLRANSNVRLLIFWNVNFPRNNAIPWDAWALFRPNGSCPACAEVKRAMGVP